MRGLIISATHGQGGVASYWLPHLPAGESSDATPSSAASGVLVFIRAGDAPSCMVAMTASGAGVAPADQLLLRAALSAYLGRYRGQTRLHTESDLRVFLRWCTDQNLDPLAALRVDIERYVRWLQDVRGHQPSTVSRRLSVVVGFYRVCVIDQILPHSPADYVRRPTVPTDSPTLGLGHLQFEALITTARLSANPNDFALVALLGLLGLRIFEACGASIADLGEEHGHRVLRVRGKGGKVVLVPLPPAVARAIDRAVARSRGGVALVAVVAGSGPACVAARSRPDPVRRYRCRGGRPGGGSVSHVVSSNPRSASRIRIGYIEPAFRPTC
jgi:integrase